MKLIRLVQFAFSSPHVTFDVWTGLRVICFVTVGVETAATASQASPDPEEEPIKNKPKKTSTLLKPGKKTKQKVLKSPRRRRKVTKAKEESKEDEKGDDDEGDDDEGDEEEVVEEGNKKEVASLNKMEKEGSESKGRRLTVGKLREEKTPYVTIREAKMVTLADKVSKHGILIAFIRTFSYNF